MRRELMGWDEETDVMQAIADFAAQAKQQYLDSLTKPPPRYVIPRWFADHLGLTQKQLDDYWLEVL